MANAAQIRYFHPEIARGALNALDLARPGIQSEREEAISLVTSAAEVRKCIGRTNEFATLRGFQPERIALGDAFTESGTDWYITPLTWARSVSLDAPTGKYELDLSSLKRTAALSRVMQSLHLMRVQQAKYLSDELATTRFAAAYKDAIRLADRLAGLAAPTSISLSDDGEIVFEWHRASGAIVIVGVAGDGEFAYSYELNGRIAPGQYPGVVGRDLPKDLQDLLRE